MADYYSRPIVIERIIAGTVHRTVRVILSPASTRYSARKDVKRGAMSKKLSNK
jgi:hypothetical protein